MVGCQEVFESAGLLCVRVCVCFAIRTSTKNVAPKPSHVMSKSQDETANESYQ